MIALPCGLSAGLLRPVVVGLLLTITVGGSLAQDTTKQSPAEMLRAAAKDGKLKFMVTTQDQIKGMLGAPQKEESKDDGDGAFLLWQYTKDTGGGEILVAFGKLRGSKDPYRLFEVNVGGKSLEIGRQEGALEQARGRPANQPAVLGTVDELMTVDFFSGLNKPSLVTLDLKGQGKALQELTFDSLTKWPTKDRLPVGFDPADLIERGKNPGLGVRKLHAEGIDGRGVAIAIIDHPLLRDHVEYARRIARYEEVESQGQPPHMHGPGVASIAVGKDCGVAPGAVLHYYADPTGRWQTCDPWRMVIETILERNKSLPAAERVRVISISQGMFSAWPGFDEWKKTLDKAAESGVLVATCDPTWLNHGMLRRIEGRDPDDPASYTVGKYSDPMSPLLVPAANRTIASNLGPNVYTYDRNGGRSWAAPYLAGLAALAFQVDPDIKPETITELWIKTAVKTEAGPVVNPVGFIDAVRKSKAPAK